MSPQRYREKADVLRAEYNKRFEEWHEKVDPAILRELNRRRVAKGHMRIQSRGSDDDSRPLNGYLRYVYEYIHLAVTVLSKVSAIICTYEMSTRAQREMVQLISRLCLRAFRVNGGH
jgi:hypothetical protein